MRVRILSQFRRFVILCHNEGVWLHLLVARGSFFRAYKHTATVAYAA